MEETKNTNVAYMEGTNETVNVEVVHDQEPKIALPMRISMISNCSIWHHS